MRDKIIEVLTGTENTDLWFPSCVEGLTDELMAVIEPLITEVELLRRHAKAQARSSVRVISSEGGTGQ